MTETIAYSTLQFHTGGLFDGKPTDERLHLVQVTASGTPGPTLCGIDRFPTDRSWPGFTVGGGFSTVRTPCASCNHARHSDLPIRGMNAAAFDQSKGS